MDRLVAEHTVAGAFILTLALLIWRQSRVATILVPLALDYRDLVRYVLGEGTPLALPPGFDE